MESKSDHPPPPSDISPPAKGARAEREGSLASAASTPVRTLSADRRRRRRRASSPPPAASTSASASQRRCRRAIEVVRGWLLDRLARVGARPEAEELQALLALVHASAAASASSDSEAPSPPTPPQRQQATRLLGPYVTVLASQVLPRLDLATQAGALASLAQLPAVALLLLGEGGDSNSNSTNLDRLLGLLGTGGGELGHAAGWQAKARRDLALLALLAAPGLHVADVGPRYFATLLDLTPAATLHYDPAERARYWGAVAKAFGRQPFLGRFVAECLARRRDPQLSPAMYAALARLPVQVLAQDCVPALLRDIRPWPDAGSDDDNDGSGSVVATRSLAFLCALGHAEVGAAAFDALAAQLGTRPSMRGRLLALLAEPPERGGLCRGAIEARTAAINQALLLPAHEEGDLRLLGQVVGLLLQRGLSLEALARCAEGITRWQAATECKAARTSLANLLLKLPLWGLLQVDDASGSGSGLTRRAPPEQLASAVRTLVLWLDHSWPRLREVGLRELCAVDPPLLQPHVGALVALLDSGYGEVRGGAMAVIHALPAAVLRPHREAILGKIQHDARLSAPSTACSRPGTATPAPAAPPALAAASVAAAVARAVGRAEVEAEGGDAGEGAGAEDEDEDGEDEAWGDGMDGGKR